MSDIVTGLYDRAIGAGGDALLMDAADEIERLQADLAATRIAFEDWKVMHSTAALEAEIERLREVHNAVWETLRRTAKESNDEIERLRSLVYSYPPTEYAPDGVTWQQEAERLRDALDFVLDAASWHFDGEADVMNESPEDMTAHVNGLIVKRVREVLGDDR